MQISPPFSEVAEALFSIIVKQDIFTKQHGCQQAASSPGFCCDAKATARRPRDNEVEWEIQICLVNSVFRLFAAERAAAIAAGKMSARLTERVSVRAQ
jgi:hypothetical protein